MKRKVLVFVLLCAVLVIGLCGCGLAGKKTKIVGNWEGYDGRKDSVCSYYEFTDDNRVIIDVHYKWDVVWDRFKYFYELKDGQILMTGGQRLMDGNFVVIQDLEPIDFKFEGTNLVLDNQYQLVKVDEFSVLNPIQKK